VKLWTVAQAVSRAATATHVVRKSAWTMAA
jgi:hypothetical protein